jgi:uncharacterized protein
MKRFDPDAVLTIFPSTRPDKGRYEEELLPLARAQKMGVIGMKTIRFARESGRSAKELLRYALSLDGVSTVVVGLDSVAHLNEAATVATNFRAMKEADRDELSRSARGALAGILPPWERSDYHDGRVEGK